MNVDPLNDTIYTHSDGMSSWLKVRNFARERPTMFIGDQQTAHRFAITHILNLVALPDVFQMPVQTELRLSGNQFLLRHTSGPLNQDIESLFTWGSDYVMHDTWLQTSRMLQSEVRPDQRRYWNWRNWFGSSTGPSLLSPLIANILATVFIVSFKTSTGYRSQEFKNGWPVSNPLNLDLQSTIGLLVAAELDPEWFWGIPYTAKDAEMYSGFANLQVYWHDNDDILQGIDDPVAFLKSRLT